MSDEKLAKLLNELADMSVEPVRPSLAEDIKRQIPRAIPSHRSKLDTINIIIDLRVSRLAAAAIIVITLVLLAGFFGRQHSTNGDIYQESKLLVRYLLHTGPADGQLATRITEFRKYLEDQGLEVIYYDDSLTAEDNDALLMHWKLGDGRYRVVFRDLRAETVDADQLIDLQAGMLGSQKGKPK